MFTRYLVPGGTGNWNSTTNWSATSGGASGASYPVIGDDVIFDINSLNANININVASACATLTCSDYTGTLTFTNTLSTTGNLVFSAGMTTSGAGSLSVASSTFSITSNGVRLRNFTGVSPTITLNDNCFVENHGKTGASGTMAINSSGGTRTFNVNGNMSIGTNTFMVCDPNVYVNLTGNCTWTGLGRPRFNLVFNSTGTITIPNLLTFDGSGYIMTYTSGTIIAPATVYFSSSRIYDVAGINFDEIIFDGNSTITLLSKLTVATITTDAAVVFTGTHGWECDTFNLGVTANTARTVTIEGLVSYRVNNGFNSIRSTNSNRAILQSSDPTHLAIFTCGSGCVMNVGYTNAIRIDSSLGKKVHSFNGVFTDTLNWSNIFSSEIAYAFQN